MKTIQLEIPEALDEKDVVSFLAVKLYESHKLSMGQAAKLAGLTLGDFMQSCGKYGVSVFTDSIEDLRNDVRVYTVL
jgi:predicted HTH domain antitoxin